MIFSLRGLSIHCYTLNDLLQLPSQCDSCTVLGHEATTFFVHLMDRLAWSVLLFLWPVSPGTWLGGARVPGGLRPVFRCCYDDPG